MMEILFVTVERKSRVQAWYALLRVSCKKLWGLKMTGMAGVVCLCLILIPNENKDRYERNVRN